MGLRGEVPYEISEWKTLDEYCGACHRRWVPLAQ